MQTKYTVTVMRHTDDGNRELVGKLITADQAIDMMLQIERMAEDTVQEDGSEGEESEPEEKEELDDEPKSEGSYKWEKFDGSMVRTAVRTGWDKEKAREMILAGESAADIAAAVGTSANNIHQYKSKLKKAGDLDPQPQSNEDTEPSGPLDVHKEKVLEMVKEGKTDTEIYNAMHDFMTAGELRLALEYAHALRIA